jgi:hypothetical protein
MLAAVVTSGLILLSVIRSLWTSGDQVH